MYRLTIIMLLCCTTLSAQLNNIQLGSGIKDSKNLLYRASYSVEDSLAQGTPVTVGMSFAESNYVMPPYDILRSKCVAMSDNGRHLVCGMEESGSSFIAHYRELAGQYTLVGVQGMAAAPIQNVVMAADAQRFAATSMSWPYLITRALDVSENFIPCLFPDFTDTPTASAPIAMTADGARLVYASTGANFGKYLLTYMWDGTKYIPGIAPDTDASNITSLAMSDDGVYLVCGRSVAPYVSAYKWDDVDTRYELMAALDQAITGTVQSLSVSADAGKMVLAYESGGYSVINAYDLDTVNNRYNFRKNINTSGSINIIKINLASHGRWFGAAYQAGANYNTGIWRACSFADTYTKTSTVAYDTRPIYDYKIIDNSNYNDNLDYKRFAVSAEALSRRTVIAGGIRPSFTFNLIGDTTFGATNVGYGYTLDAIPAFVPGITTYSRIKMLTWTDVIAPYLE